MKNNNGFYIGFLLFGLQIIGGDIYRHQKNKQQEKRIKLLFNKYNI
jgi:hypothetical protein